MKSFRIILLVAFIGLGYFKSCSAFGSRSDMMKRHDDMLKNFRSGGGFGDSFGDFDMGDFGDGKGSVTITKVTNVNGVKSGTKTVNGKETEMDEDELKNFDFGNNDMGDWMKDFKSHIHDSGDSFGSPKKETSPVEKLDKKSDCKCRSRAASRIVRGEIVERNAIPWQVSLADPMGNHFCGGSILNKNYIITAKHCTEGMTARQMKVRVGLHRFDDEDIKEKTHDVAEIIEYPNWTSKNLQKPGDVSILRLVDTLEFEDGKIEPACLNLEKTEYHKELMASGWGVTSKSVRSGRTGEVLSSGDVSEVLKKAFFNPDKCEGDMDEFLICIKGSHGDSTCQGDSGGPLHYTDNGKTTVQGVLSFGTGKRVGQNMEGCIGNSTYARLSYFKKWIESKIEDNYCTA